MGVVDLCLCAVAELVAVCIEADAAVWCEAECLWPVLVLDSDACGSACFYWY